MKKIVLSASLAALFFCTTAKAQTKIDSTKLKQYDLEEVVISGSRTNTKLKDLPNKVEVIKVSSVIEGAYTSAADLLKNNSGVDVLQYPGKLGAIGMRGFAPSTSNKYNVLLINGLPAGTKNIATIDPSMIEKVEIMKGPFSSLYGSSAMGGVINFVTKRSTGDISGKVSVAYGSFETSKVAASLGGDLLGDLNFDLHLYSDIQGDNYKVGDNNFLHMSDQEKAIVSEDTYGAEFKNTSYKSNGGNLRLGYNINPYWTIDVNGGIYAARDIMVNGSFWEVYGSDRKDITRYNTNLELNGKVGSNNIRFAPFYSEDFTEYYSDTSDEAFKTSDQTFKNYGFQLQDRIEFEGHNVVIGIDHNAEENFGNKWTAKDVVGVTYNPDYQLSSSAILAQGHFKFLDDKLNLTAGVRADNISFEIESSTDHATEGDLSEDHLVVNPNVGIKYELVPGVNFHTSYGTAFFSPDAYQKAGKYSTSYGYKFVGNADLDPESSITYDIGFGLKKVEAGYDFDVTYFQTKHEDMIIKADYAEEEGTSTYVNANEANMNGLELKASYDFGALYDYDFSLKAYMNMTFMFDAKMKMNGGEQEEDLNYVRERSGNFGLILTNNNFSVKANARYSGSRLENNWYGYYNVRPGLVDPVTEKEPAILEHPDFMVFDATAMYDINNSITVGITANNILDENYTEKDGYNMPGRNFMAKMMFKF